MHLGSRLKSRCPARVFCATQQEGKQSFARGASPADAREIAAKGLMSDCQHIHERISCGLVLLHNPDTPIYVSAAQCWVACSAQHIAHYKRVSAAGILDLPSASMGASMP